MRTTWKHYRMTEEQLDCFLVSNGLHAESNGALLAHEGEKMGTVALVDDGTFLALVCEEGYRQGEDEARAWWPEFRAAWMIVTPDGEMEVGRFPTLLEAVREALRLLREELGGGRQSRRSSRCHLATGIGVRGAADELYSRDPSEVRQYILRQAQDRLLDRAACGEWPAPQTEAEWLAWMLDELEIQADMLRDGQGDEAEKASKTAFAGILSKAILPEELARDAAGRSGRGVGLYPSDHPGQQHYASCPDGGQHLLIAAAGPQAVFQENYWPVLGKPDCDGR